MTESATATALLDAAETEFANHGIDEASLRAIMRSAGANPAAVHYHFGSREALARAVLDRVLVPINERRLELLAELQARSGEEPPTLAQLLEGIVRPDLEAARQLAGRGPGNARLIGLIYIQPTLFVKELVEEKFRPVASAYLPDLAIRLAHLTPGEISWRIRWCLFGLLGAVLSADEPPIDLDDTDREVRRIVTIAAGALAAPGERDP